MHAFDVLSDPVRRHILESLVEGEHSSGELVSVVEREFKISQSAVSQHIRILHDNGFATVRNEGARRVYSLDTSALQAVEPWLEQFRGFWTHRLEALAIEVARGKRRHAKSRSK